MKRVGVVLCLSLLLTAMATGLCFAGDFSVTKTFPHEGDDSLNPVNIAVKVEFSDPVAGKAAQKANADCFSLVDKSGKKIKVTPLYNEKAYPNEVWVQVSRTLKDASKYKFTISGDFVNNDGQKLGKDYVTTFSTRDTAKDSKVNMGIMALMFVGMMGFTVWETKHKLKKEEEEKKAASNQKVNPYKEAKKTGKSVEEVVAKTEKEKAKKAKRVQAKVKTDEPVVEELPDDGKMHVKAARPIAAAGGSLPKSVAARREAQAKAEAERLAERTKTKSKGSKQQQRKNKK